MIDIKYIDQYKGQELWACGLIISKAGRRAEVHLKPIKIKITEINNTGASWYQAPPYLVAEVLKKNGTSTNKTISSFDNYHFFDDELECLEKYSELNKRYLKEFEIFWGKKQSWADKKKEEFIKNIRDGI